jgi:hypothetical protein
VPTTAITITGEYTKLVDTAVAAFTLQVLSDQGVELVFVAAAPAETAEGLFRDQYQEVTRATGTGHVYGRVPAKAGAVVRGGRVIVVT